jgi:hypothetical protein
MVPVVKKQLSWNTFIMALAYVESKWNDTVVNPLSGATGFLQLTEVYVDQINIWGYNYSYEDRFNRGKSIEMFEITNKILNPQKDFHLALVIHNPKATIKYHNAVMQKYESLKSKYERR